MATASLEKRDGEIVVVTNHPRPFWVDQPIHKVETLEKDGDREVKFVHHFAALNAGNERLLHDREAATERAVLKMTKGRFRPRLPKEDEANKTFYRALIRGGGFRPMELPPSVIDLGTVPAEAHEIYTKSGDIYRAGFFPLTVEEMKEFDVERMERAIDRWFKCNGEVVSSGRGLKDIRFMQAKGGIIKVRLNIGDPENPAYRIKAHFRKPEQHKRFDFKQEFAYNIDHTVGEQGKIETVINLEQGIAFTNEHFIGISTEPDTDKHGKLIEYSKVVLTDTRTVEERIEAGEQPRPTSAVEVDDVAEDGKTGHDGTTEQDEVIHLLDYDDSLRQRFLDALHPMFKVEMAATAVASFQSANRE